MNDEALKLLEQLQDIHIPDPPGFWPLAPGWYLLLALLFICCMLGLYQVYHRLGTWRSRRAGLAQLKAIEAQYLKIGDAHQAFEAMSVLTRRVAMVFYGADVAGLTGAKWLDFLDRTGKTQAFSQGVGHHLLHAPYQTDEKISDPQVMDTVALLRQWIRRCRSC